MIMSTTGIKIVTADGSRTVHNIVYQSWGLRVGHREMAINYVLLRPSVAPPTGRRRRFARATPALTPGEAPVV